ncbi:hypothetical protein ABEB22_05695 [Thioclava sp. 'Guangxiensis']|uniref:hypothetical protein n=1 Tax=Thioclava sp. 'Guangxiensis' TaxID=3149044 RepID=UPI003877A97C
MTNTNPSVDQLKTAATNRAFDTFLRAAHKESCKLSKAGAEWQKAFGATMPTFLETLDEEALATGPNRRKIASYPLRPNALIAQLDAEAKKAGDQEGLGGSPLDKGISGKPSTGEAGSTDLS